MTKYSYELKKEIVDMYFNNQGGYRVLSNLYGVDRSHIREWVLKYELHGVKGLAGGGNTYSDKIKIEIIQYMEKEQLSITETSIRFNIGSRYTLSKWYDKYKNGALPMTAKKTRSNKQTETLEQEVERLRAENAYLKKLGTLIQEENLNKKKSRLQLSCRSKKNLNSQCFLK